MLNFKYFVSSDEVPVRVPWYLDLDKELSRMIELASGSLYSKAQIEESERRWWKENTRKAIPYEYFL